MKRLTLLAFGCLSVTMVPSSASSQDAAAQIERALLPLPARTREEATVVRWRDDFTWEVVKDGTNPWVCYDRSADPAEAEFSVQCTSLANLPRVAQNRKFGAEGANRRERSALITAAGESGERIDAEFGSMFISMSGADLESAGIHTTIAVPYATGESTGLPESGSQGGAFVMAAGTSEAHIMVPGR